MVAMFLVLADHLRMIWRGGNCAHGVVVVFVCEADQPEAFDSGHHGSNVEVAQRRSNMYAANDSSRT